jgi:hypothetical protein
MASLSLKDLLTKEGRKERSMQKLCAKAVNSKIKPDDRRPALYALIDEAQHLIRDDGEVGKEEAPGSGGEAAPQIDPAQLRYSEDAVKALLLRFGFNYDTNIVVDEEEKNTVYEALLYLGSRILPQIIHHLKTSPTLSWGLRLLHEICDHETTWEVLAEVLKNYDPEYERDPTRKLQLMTFLGDFKDARSVEALLPFLEDHDGTVRFVTAEALFKQGDERAREPLLKLMTNEEEESLRIKNRIAEGFHQTGWNTKGFRGTVEKLLPSEYIVDGKGRIKLKKARE